MFSSVPYESESHVESYLKLLGCWLRAKFRVSRALWWCFWALSSSVSKWRDWTSSPRRERAICRGSMAADTCETNLEAQLLKMNIFICLFICPYLAYKCQLQGKIHGNLCILGI